MCLFADEKIIEEYCKEHDVERSALPQVVVIESLIAYDQLPALYRAANVYVTTAHGEGWGLPLVESMACGLPVIGTFSFVNVFFLFFSCLFENNENLNFRFELFRSSYCVGRHRCNNSSTQDGVSARGRQRRKVGTDRARRTRRCTGRHVRRRRGGSTATRHARAQCGARTVRGGGGGASCDRTARVDGVREARRIWLGWQR